MPNNPVEPIRESMTFSDYFSTHEDVRDILESFGYGYTVKSLELPMYRGEVVWAETLKSRLLQIIPNVTLTGEASKREFLIAPILAELVIHYGVLIRAEFVLRVSSRLQGMIDYLVQAENNLVVIEAKQGDLQRGFRQLAAEIIAVDKWSTLAAQSFYGAVSLGDSWRFVHLDRETKIMTLDINLINVPEDTERLVRVLIAALFGEDSIVTDRTPSA